jgi:hypothetical protein
MPHVIVTTVSSLKFLYRAFESKAALYRSSKRRVAMSAEEGPDLQTLSREELIALCEELASHKTQLEDEFERAFHIVDELEQENKGKNENQTRDSCRQHPCG